MLSLITTAVLHTSATLLAPPPPTRVEVVTEQLHGQTINDPYRWLEALENDSEEVIAWTTAQNGYTRGILDNLPMRDRIEARLAELMTIGSIGAPVMAGDRYFYRERKGAENQSILYVREGHDGEPRILIDPNTLDENGLYSLGWFEPTDDGSLLAFGLSYAGDEMTVLYVMDVATGTWLADEIPGKVHITGWLADNSGFSYGILEDPADAYSRAYKLHTLGTHYRGDPVIVRQEEPSRIPFAGITKDGRWLVMGESEGWARNDLSIADAVHWRRTGEVNTVPVAVGLDGRFSPEAFDGDTMFLSSTFEAPNGEVFAVDLNAPQRKNWRRIIPERVDAVLQGLSHARGILVAQYEKDATSRFELFSMRGDSLGKVKLPGSGLGSAGLSTNDDRTEAFLTFTSYDQPTSIYRFDLAGDGDMELWARPEVPVDPSSITVKQVFVSSKDGTRVPMFIVHRKGLSLDGDNSCVLYGYGGFNISMTPRFSATRFPWYEDGGVFAVANLRGGSEYGEEWHRAGMLGNKQNVFDDFYACAEYLIEEGYTNPDRLGCQGGSNGGLLTGVAVTQRPDLFSCAVSAVPLLDMLRFDQFLMAKFWVPEYGSPSDPEHFKWIRAYSPYHNVVEGQKYPSVLFTAGENDSRVHPLHARKMVALMQERAGNNLDEDPIMLWVDREGGHGSGKPLSARIREVADQHIFFAWQTGMLDEYLEGD